MREHKEAGKFLWISHYSTVTKIFLPLSWKCQRSYTNMTVQDPWALLGLIFFSFSFLVGGQVTTVSPASAEALWMKILSSLTSKRGPGKKAIALAITCGWGGSVQLWDLRWTPKRRKQTVTENRKQSQEDPELRERNLCYEDHELPSEDLSSYCHNLLQTDTDPFLLEGNWICQLWYQKYIEKVRIKSEKRPRC